MKRPVINNDAYESAATTFLTAKDEAFMVEYNFGNKACENEIP